MRHTFGFIHEIEHVSFICDLESTNIIVSCAFEDHGEVGEVDTERDWTIAVVSFENGG
jgi:hypothetical protein